MADLRHSPAIVLIFCDFFRIFLLTNERFVHAFADHQTRPKLFEVCPTRSKTVWNTRSATCLPDQPLTLLVSLSAGPGFRVDTHGPVETCPLWDRRSWPRWRAHVGSLFVETKSAESLPPAFGAAKMGVNRAEIRAPLFRFPECRKVADTELGRASAPAFHHVADDVREPAAQFVKVMRWLAAHTSD